MRIIAIISCAALTACNSVTTTPADISSLGAFGVLDDALNTALSNPTLMINTPASANYTGLANVIIGSDSSTNYIGDMTLAVNFSGGGVSGTIDQFESYASTADPATTIGTPTAGSIALAGTVTEVISLPFVTGSATGTVNTTAGSATMSGNFYGDNADYVQINFFGDFGGIAVGQQ